MSCRIMGSVMFAMAVVSLLWRKDQCEGGRVVVGGDDGWMAMESNTLGQSWAIPMPQKLTGEEVLS